MLLPGEFQYELHEQCAQQTDHGVWRAECTMQFPPEVASWLWPWANTTAHWLQDVHHCSQHTDRHSTAAHTSRLSLCGPVLCTLHVDKSPMSRRETWPLLECSLHLSADGATDLHIQAEQAFSTVGLLYSAAAVHFRTRLLYLTEFETESDTALEWLDLTWFTWNCYLVWKLPSILTGESW